ncbi:hypothetical protein K505DRAFT_422684 [Melanomma pulvis-pyrius CBS 109.77]|uniref:Uncharacterized protein n=1 Tax=Melanomma pulvis-pyrius CBS 109.77 TaxID=1314802 RepID=A0A6A6WPM7_9PLEO|nr:hypothetical protein K505DRAFT_422684 [Melanomma pulvis-pyrius CBS 109.77]
MLPRIALCAVMALTGVHAAVDIFNGPPASMGSITSGHSTRPVDDSIAIADQKDAAGYASLEACPATSMPRLCTGDVTMDGALSRLTYLCPTKTRQTVYVTVTVTETEVPTVTAIVTEAPSTVNSKAPEPTTTITLFKTSTVFKTLTLQRATASPVKDATSARPSEVATHTSSIVTSDITTSTSTSTSTSDLAITSSTEPDETTSTQIVHTTKTVIQTITLSPSPLDPVFPTLTLSANGSTTAGIFYSRPANNSSYVATGTCTGTGTGTGTAVMHVEPRDNAVTTVYQTTYVNLTTVSDHHHPTSTPTAAYPGAVTAAVGGKGDALGRKVSLAALFGAVMLAAMIL